MVVLKRQYIRKKRVLQATGVALLEIERHGILDATIENIPLPNYH